jgi:hypothetical protein
MIIGFILGFIYFLFELESPNMGGVLFRPNSDGIIVFSFESLINIMIAPFRYISFWTNYELYSINWIITTLIGGFLYYIFFIILDKLNELL